MGDYRKTGQELMGYIQGDNSKKPEAFKLQRFAIDMNTLKAVCPAGKESASASFDGRNIRISFSRAVCKDCDSYQDCVGERKAGVRKLTLTPGYEYVRERREVQQTEAYREEMKVRAQVEGTISEGVRFFGLRRAKYKGEDGHKIQFYMTGAALNVKRLIKAITKGIEISTKPTLAYKT